jgi:YbbR domain-containing protein
MKNFISQLGKVIPTFLTAVLLAVAVWVSAVIEKDPTEERTYPQPVTVEVVGQDPGLVIISSPPRTVNVVLKAPVSTWEVLNNTPGSVRAFIDLSALQEGTHVLPVQVQVSAGPVQIVSYTPATAELVLDRLMSRTFDVHVVQRGQVATGYQTGTLQLDQKQVTVTGPATLVERVSEVRAVLDVGQAQQTIQRTLSLVAMDSGEQVVSGET